VRSHFNGSVLIPHYYILRIRIAKTMRRRRLFWLFNKKNIRKWQFNCSYISAIK